MGHLSTPVTEQHCNIIVVVKVSMVQTLMWALPIVACACGVLSLVSPIPPRQTVAFVQRILGSTVPRRPFSFQHPQTH